MKKSKFKINIGVWSLIFIAICALLVAVDLLTKLFEEAHGWEFTVIPKLIRVVSGTRNQGCAFSFLNDNPEVGQPILITFTIILLLGIIGIFLVVPERLKLTKLALAVIAAGAIGNLVDRCAYRMVRDFIELNMIFSWASCNIADFCIVIGTAMLVVDILFINDWAIFPKTKSARAAHEKREAEERAKKAKAAAGAASDNAGAANSVNARESSESLEISAESAPENVNSPDKNTVDGDTDGNKALKDENGEDGAA